MSQRGFPLFCFVVFLCVSCGRGDDGQKLPTNSSQERVEMKTEDSQQPVFVPVIVYKDKGFRDNHFVPSGFMPNGECLKLDEDWLENCQEGTTCIKVIFDTVCSRKGQKWGGIYWLNPADNWGGKKAGFNLDGAKRLSFWAKGERGCERIEEFKVGGITGAYPDSDSAVIGPVRLGTEWRQYTIDLRGKDLSYISGGFSWATNVDVNAQECAQEAAFYLDDIKFE